MRNPKHSGWTEQPDGKVTAKIGRTEVEIFPPCQWNFWRGDHKGVPCHTGPGNRYVVAFKGSHSGSALTLEGAKVLALWCVSNDLTGRAPPDSIFAQDELDARLLYEKTVEYVDRTYGET